MRHRQYIRLLTQLKLVYIVLFCFISLGVTACQEESLSPIRNAFFPEHNEIVLDQRYIGERNGQYAIWQLEKGNTGILYYRGYEDPNYGFSLSPQFTETVLIHVGQDGEILEDTTNDDWLEKYIVGKVGINGNQLWSRSTGFVNRCIDVINDGQGLWENALVSVGTKGDSCYGQIIRQNGELVAQFSYGFPLSITYLNSVIYQGRSRDDYEFFLAGGVLEKLSFQEYPLLIKGSVDESTFELRLDKVVILYDYPNKYVVNAVESEDGILFISMDEDKNVIPNPSVFVTRLDENLHPTWIQVIDGEVNQADHSLQSLIWDEGSLFIVGEGDDIDKPHSQGLNRNSGFVVCIRDDGTILWRQKIVGSKWNENLLSVKVKGASVYVAGIHAQVYFSTSRESFGNGLISKLDRNTGKIIAGYTINDIYKDPDTTYRAEIRTIDIVSEDLIFGGLVNKQYENGTYRAWYGRIKLEDL